ncbi:MAG: hypothetical protein H7066_05670 [Cytophagaceae bacterium]|nr:hypothetical protein [Gemmatimonadaceae bacterium]
MVVSPAEREELVRRVTERVAHRKVDDALVRSVVDRVVGALATREVASVAGTAVVVVSAASMPDLASRLRAALRSVEFQGAAVASEGRHTVFVARVDAAGMDSVRTAAQAIGARFVVREQA